MKHKVTRKWNLELTFEEALWLRMVMQNPLNDTKVIEEDATDQVMRAAFFNAVKDAVVLERQEEVTPDNE